MIATERCYRLTIALKSMSTRIPYEDAQLAATHLIQCAANVLSVKIFNIILKKYFMIYRLLMDHYKNEQTFLI